MSNMPKFVKVETPFKGKDFEKLIVTPVSKTRKYFWGLWSRSETEIYYFVPSGFYKLQTLDSDTPSRAKTEPLVRKPEAAKELE